ncbi:MAG: hypothetical protein ACW99G_03610 [Candidatus Thorarchaeota archaeon]|jgi:hypothetical protein
MNRAIIGMYNFPKINKFVIIQECGHKLFYDHTVDSIEEYKSGDSLRCIPCMRNKEPEGIDELWDL